MELLLWYAVFASANLQQLGGYPLENYVAYAIWGSFISRIAANWMYEFRMIYEIENGTVNNLLVRPVSFYEYYLGQYFGYKVITTVVSMTIPIAITYWFDLPVQLSRLLPVLSLVVYYIVLMHTMSFCVASLALTFNRVGSITVAKNFVLWLLSGELFPLDLLPEPYRHWMILQPFSSAVYLPAGYLTGRVDLPALQMGFVSVTAGICFFGLLAHLLWRNGIRNYSGQGA